ncbi:GNAT family N-acetyltransferase [Chungangia koreensis]|uniref:GNAT family N-acetyltransferase n=1 Tax=Chungangia koreensis TaxID=752657 RepID=A0ABV8X914_9LACT
MKRINLNLAVQMMNNRPNVKEYSSEYQEQVVELILQIQQQEYNIPISKEDQPDLFKIEEFYQTGNGNFWVAIYDEKVVGTISLLDIGNHHVALRKMFVRKEYRGAIYKTASLLLETALNWAKTRDVHAVYLGTTPQFLAAHRFYEKNGFISIPPTELPKNFPILQVDKKFYKYDLNT